MILNGRQLVISKAQADRFRRALADAEAQPRARGQAGQKQAASTGALRAQLEDLEAQILAYESLAQGTAPPLHGRLADLGTLLVQARIARGWSQRELGDRLGIKMQAVQRYEATKYQAASLTRLLEVVQALDVQADVMLALLTKPDLKAWSAERKAALAAK